MRRRDSSDSRSPSPAPHTDDDREPEWVLGEEAEQEADELDESSQSNVQGILAASSEAQAVQNVDSVGEVTLEVPLLDRKAKKQQLEAEPKKPRRLRSRVDAVIKDEAYSAGAERLYAAISAQSRYSEREALDLLLSEVEAARGGPLDASELLGKLELEEATLRGRSASWTRHADRLRQEGEEDEQGMGSRERRTTSQEEAEEGSDVAAATGFAASSLASVARVLSRGDSMDLVETSNVVASSLASNVESLVDYALTKLKAQWRQLLHGIFPVHHLQTMLLVCLVQLISVERMLRVVPVMLTYVAFAAMLYTTLRMFHSKRVIRQTHVWRRLLTVFKPKDEEAEEDEAANASQYSLESWEPYVGFTIATVVFILCFGLCGKYVPNCLLLCGVSLFLCAFCFVGLTDEMDWLAIVAFALNLTAHLPAIQKKLRLRRWALFNDWAAPRVAGVKVTMSLGSLAFLAIPALYAVACLGRSKRDVVRLLIPQLVCFAWSDTALTLFMAGFVKLEIWSVVLTGAIISLFLFPSGTGLVVVGSILLGQLKGSLGLWAGVKALSILAVLFLPLIWQKLKSSFDASLLAGGEVRRQVGGWRRWLWEGQSRRTKTALAALVYGVLVLGALSLLYQGSGLGPGQGGREVANLSWTDFEATCGLPPKGDDNQVAKQELCSQLKGTGVRWMGSVQSVRVAKVDNSLEALLDYLPEALEEWLRCFYGGTETGWGGQESCSLHRHHWYTFEVEVVGPWGEKLISSNKGSVILTASHTFHPLLRVLREGDVVKFLAYFDTYPVTKWTPKLRLLHMSCSTCAFLSEAKGKPRPPPDSPDFVPSEVTDLTMATGFWSRMTYAFKFLFNFVFSPALYIST